MLEKFCQKIDILQKVFKEMNFNIFLACLFSEEEHQTRIYRSVSVLKDSFNFYSAEAIIKQPYMTDLVNSKNYELFVKHYCPWHFGHIFRTVVLFSNMRIMMQKLVYNRIL